MIPAILLASLLPGPGATTPAAAQVTTSQQALDALGSGRPASRAHAPHAPARHRAAAQPARRPARGGRAAQARTVQNGAPHPPAATIPPAPPPAPVFRAPVLGVPLHPPPPPPPVPVVQGAAGTATPIPGGTRISFGSGSVDLNPQTMQALHGISDRLRGDPAARVDLDAFGAVGEDDSSTPRRLAFERGVAARAVLINDGIASTRIYLRVIGSAQAASGPVPGTASGAAAPTPDRVDLVLSSATPDAAPPAAQPAPGRGAP